MNMASHGEEDPFQEIEQFLRDEAESDEATDMAQIEVTRRHLLDRLREMGIDTDEYARELAELTDYDALEGISYMIAADLVYVTETSQPGDTEQQQAELSCKYNNSLNLIETYGEELSLPLRTLYDQVIPGGVEVSLLTQSDVELRDMTVDPGELVEEAKSDLKAGIRDELWPLLNIFAETTFGVHDDNEERMRALFNIAFINAQKNVGQIDEGHSDWYAARKYHLEELTRLINPDTQEKVDNFIAILTEGLTKLLAHIRD